MSGARGEGDVIAVVDDSVGTDCHGSQYDCTVRRVDCSILCEKSGQYPLRCKPCQRLHSTLRSIVSHEAVHDSRTSASSHTRYRDLTPSKKDERMKNLHCALKLSNQRVKQLQVKVTKLIANESMRLQDEDVTDISQVMAEVGPVVEDTLLVDSPQWIFWKQQQQQQYNRLKDKRQMRWHPLVVGFSLNLKYLSGTAYRAIHQCGIISLPSEHTLFDYTHWAKVHTGV